MKPIVGPLLAGIVLLAGALTASAQEKKEPTVPYPLKTCIVTENDLDSMGGEIRRVYNGQEVKFCCRPCIKKFEKDPARYLERMRKEAEAATATSSTDSKAKS